MRRTGWVIARCVVCAAVLLLFSAGGALAATLQEDPEAVTPEFDGTALFQYYSYCLDAVLLKDATETETRFNRVPWANVPEQLLPSTSEFAASGTTLAKHVSQVADDLARLSMLRKQSRLDEAAGVAAAISDMLGSANRALQEVEDAITASGREFGAASAPEEGELRTSYQGVWDRIDRTGRMLATFGRVLAAEKQAMDFSGLPPAEQPERSQITLLVDPVTAFVGETVSFRGMLTSPGGPLALRSVEILLDSSTYVTVSTDMAGYYHGTLEVPYLYHPEMEVQALYHPQNEDTGTYLGSLSPPVGVRVQYYDARLSLAQETRAYPGRQAGLRLSFDYGNAPVPTARLLKIYVDGRLVIDAEVPASGSTVLLDVDHDAAPGSHVLSASAAAAGPYAPSKATADLEIIRAVPILEAELPRVIFAPGALNFTGRIVSELGPLDGLPVKVGVGKSEATLASGAGGVVTARIGLGMSLSIAGWQDVTVRAEPTEPWHSPLSVTRRVFAVNVVNSSGAVIVLALLGIYLPSRLKRRLGVASLARESPVPRALSPRAGVNPVTSSQEVDRIANEPGAQILYWYRQAARTLLGSVTGVRKPGQTLREFAADVQQVLGPAGGSFVQLTRLLERILYSSYKPTAGEIEESKQLSLSVSSRVKK